MASVKLKRDWYVGNVLYKVIDNPVEVPDRFCVKGILPSGAVVLNAKEAKEEAASKAEPKKDEPKALSQLNTDTVLPTTKSK